MRGLLLTEVPLACDPEPSHFVQESPPPRPALHQVAVTFD